MTKYELKQKLEVFGLTYPDELHFNNQIVIVVALPGYDPRHPDSYGVLAKDGMVHPASPRHLRPFPPTLANGRGDLDAGSTWEAFDKATGLDSSTFRKEGA